MYFVVRDVDNLKIKLPKYLQVANPTNATIAGQVVSVNPRHNVNSTNIDLAEMDIAKIVLDGNDGKVNGGTLSIPKTEVSLSPLHAPSLRPQAANSRSTFISTWVTPSSDKTKWSSTM